MSRMLGLDFGTKRIGVAVSDELFLIAHARGFILRKDLKTDLNEIDRIIKEDSIIEVVVGLPLNMNGTYSEKTKEASAFTESLMKSTAVPVKTWDERLTSRQAENIMLEADLSRAKRRHLSDKIAAQIILQSYLDSRKRI